MQNLKIDNLITKFYYKNNQLCFQILLAYADGETKLFQEFTDYAAYKLAYDKLLEAKEAEAFVSVENNTAQKTYINFA